MCSCSILKFELVSYPTKLFVMMSKRLCLNLLMSCLLSLESNLCLKIRLEIWNKVKKNFSRVHIHSCQMKAGKILWKITEMLNIPYSSFTC